jgi:hypothetical protein
MSLLRVSCLYYFAEQDETPRPVQHKNRLTCPGDFEDMEENKSMDVHTGNGISLAFIKLIHRHSPMTNADLDLRAAPVVRDPAVLQAQMQLMSPRDPQWTVALEDRSASPVWYSE